MQQQQTLNQENRVVAAQSILVQAAAFEDKVLEDEPKPPMLPPHPEPAGMFDSIWAYVHSTIARIKSFLSSSFAFRAEIEGQQPIDSSTATVI
jgi:hypothetical protein